jgi:hypothetical protein
MRNYPQEIERLNREIAETQSKLDEMRDVVRIVEARYTKMVLERTNGDGRPMHTNDLSRSTALLLDLNDDESWKESKQEIREWELEIRIKQAAIESLRAEFQLAVLMRKEQLVTRQLLIA